VTIVAVAVNLSISLEQPGKKLALFGSADRHLRLIRDSFEVQVVNRDDQLRLSGEAKQDCGGRIG
jgi:phosphate starvation-inducible protein PhoH